MVSHKFKCIFVHIPKAAGQSIENFFLDLHGLSWDNRGPLLLRRNEDRSLGPERLAHLTANEYIDCGHISKSDFHKYFKFAFVRNPWARLVSEYRYRGYSKRYSFREFVLSGFIEKNTYLDTYRHLMPQYHFLYNEGGELLVDFVGRFENLQSDFDHVCAKLRIKCSKLRHLNSSSHSDSRLGRLKRILLKRRKHENTDHRLYYDKELIDIVANFYCRDIDVFKYNFDK